jgi:hypothetical protein
MQELTSLGGNHTIPGDLIKKGLVELFEFIIPAKNGFIFLTAGFDIFVGGQSGFKTIRAASLFVDFEFSFPKDGLLDQIFVHKILLLSQPVAIRFKKTV